MGKAAYLYGHLGTVETKMIATVMAIRTVYIRCQRVPLRHMAQSHGT